MPWLASLAGPMCTVPEADMGLVDTHCHLNDPEAFPDPAAAIAEARAAGVDQFIVIGIEGESNARALRLAEQFDCVFAAVGWHPNSCGQLPPSAIEELRSQLVHPKVVALGEIGLDYYREHTPPDEQRAALLMQLDLAAELGKPVVLHCRNAYGDLLDLLEARPPQAADFHCFSGDADDLDRALRLPGVIGVDGPLTYPRAHLLRSLISECPRDRVLLETDSPYLPPQPHRGKPNHPRWLPLVAGALAEIWETEVEEVVRITSENARRFFGLPTPV
jgi:TatD DNase family protein